MPVAFGTAHDCLFEFGRPEAGDSVLVQAGASGVGIAAIQLAKRIGARVLATASSDSKLERLREFGLDDGINYAERSVVAEVLSLTEGRGWTWWSSPSGGRDLLRQLGVPRHTGGDASRWAMPEEEDRPWSTCRSLRAEEPDAVAAISWERSCCSRPDTYGCDRVDSRRRRRGAAPRGDRPHAFRSPKPSRPTGTSRAGRPSAGWSWSLDKPSRNYLTRQTSRPRP